MGERARDPRGYYNKPEATREALSGEWFRTGDLFRQDENGTTSRAASRIRSRRSGENISAREIETIASGIEGVFETAAVAVPDELRGEEVKLCLVLQPGYSREQVTPEAVARYCAERLPRSRCRATSNTCGRCRARAPTRSRSRSLPVGTVASCSIVSSTRGRDRKNKSACARCWHHGYGSGTAVGLMPMAEAARYTLPTFPLVRR